jgi:hypothetical protein
VGGFLLLRSPVIAIGGRFFFSFSCTVLKTFLYLCNQLEQALWLYGLEGYSFEVKDVYERYLRRTSLADSRPKENAAVTSNLDVLYSVRSKAMCIFEGFLQYVLKWVYPLLILVWQ